MRTSLAMQQLLADAFRHCCSVDIQDAQLQSAISAQRQSFEHLSEQVLATDSEQLQAVFYRAGVLPTQSALFNSGGDLLAAKGLAADFPHAEKTNWELVSAIEQLGNSSIQIAKALLPEKLKELAEEWSWVESGRQREICEELFLFLRHFHRREGEEEGVEQAEESVWMRDYNRQEPERIFPRYFLKSESHEPNCLGKAQMLLAFFELAGANTLGLTPVFLSETAIHQTLSDLGSALESLAERNGRGLGEKLKSRLKKRRDAVELWEASPGRFHMCVAVELADKSWFLIDPHMQVRGPVSDPRLCGPASEIISLLSVVQPGLCLLNGNGEELAAQQLQAAMAAGVPFELWMKIESQWRGVDDHPAAAIPLFGMSNALELFIEEGIGLLEGEKELFQKVLAGEQYAILTFTKAEGDEAVSVRFQTQSGRQLSVEQTMRLQIAMRILHTLAIESADDLKRFDDQRLHAKGLYKVLEILPALAYRKAAETMGVGPKGGSLLHPFYELYEPAFRVGVEQIAHLNALGNKDDQVIMELAALCGGQHHLALAATQSLRTRTDSVSRVSWEAIEVLQSAPVRLPLADEALHALEAEGHLYADATDPDAAAASTVEAA